MQKQTAEATKADVGGIAGENLLIEARVGRQEGIQTTSADSDELSGQVSLSSARLLDDADGSSENVSS